MRMIACIGMGVSDGNTIYIMHMGEQQDVYLIRIEQK